jgi:hypothetical protein
MWSTLIPTGARKLAWEGVCLAWGHWCAPARKSLMYATVFAIDCISRLCRKTLGQDVQNVMGPSLHGHDMLHWLDSRPSFLTGQWRRCDIVGQCAALPEHDRLLHRIVRLAHHTKYKCVTGLGAQGCHAGYLRLVHLKGNQYLSAILLKYPGTIKVHDAGAMMSDTCKHCAQDRIVHYLIPVLHYRLELGYIID